MGYTIRAVLAKEEIFAPPPAWIADSRVIPLAAGISMIPFSSKLCEQFGPEERPLLYDSYDIFLHLPEGLVPELQALSAGGTIVYVESEYHGGSGEQQAMAWKDGKVLMAPEESRNAINSALWHLEITSEPGKDRFDTLGLGRERSVDDWLEAE